MKCLLIIPLAAISMLHAQDLTHDMVAATTKQTMSSFSSYTAKNGEVFKVGDKITIGQPSNGLFFNYIKEGDGVMTPLEKASTRAAGDQVEIKRIMIYGTKGFGFYAYLRTKGGWIGYGIEIENAITSGELVTSVISSDQALEQLKRAKDKLDLGLITQIEYDSIKVELAKLIK